MAIGCGGFVGAVSRHFVAEAVTRLLGSGFPWGILTTNVLGGLLMGILVETLALKASLPHEVRLFLATGVLGGFTTFSTFSLEVMLLYERGETGLALLYAVVSVVLSVGALALGLTLVRWLA
jgi:CrcB protein